MTTEIERIFILLIFLRFLCTSRKWILARSQVRFSDYSFADIPILTYLTGVTQVPSNRRDRISRDGFRETRRNIAVGAFRIAVRIAIGKFSSRKRSAIKWSGHRRITLVSPVRVRRQGGVHEQPSARVYTHTNAHACKKLNRV